MRTSVKYEVHSSHGAPVTVTATVSGREVEASVPGLVVELVGNGCGHTFRLLPDSHEHLMQMREMFTVGKGVLAVFESIKE